jgi:hypothetical protein
LRAWKIRKRVAPPASFAAAGGRRQSFIDRVGAQRIADCGDYRMAEVMPTNCLWRASRVFALPAWEKMARNGARKASVAGCGAGIMLASQKQ